MPCYYPLKMSRAAEPNANGKRPLVANTKFALIDGSTVIVPCGRCRGCRARRAQEWTIRCQHEASLNGDKNAFITLTYDDEHLPRDYSVKKRDYQLFMKRLRNQNGSGIRFFACGEYGDTTYRPHYHSLLLNFDLPDKKFLRTRDEHRIYTSEALSELWPHGSHEIGTVTAASAGYVARYTFKKMTGPKAESYYHRFSPVTGELHHVEPEFALMSRRPGIGAEWFDKYHADAFPSDFVIVDGRQVLPPNYYMLKLKQRDEAAAQEAASIVAASEPDPEPRRRFFSAPKSTAERLQRKRKLAAARPDAKANATARRLRDREEIHLAREKRLVRTL